MDLEDYLPRLEAIADLGVGESTFDRLVAKGVIKQYIIKGTNIPRYSRLELLEMVVPKHV